MVVAVQQDFILGIQSVGLHHGPERIMKPPRLFPDKAGIGSTRRNFAQQVQQLPGRVDIAGAGGKLAIAKTAGHGVGHRPGGGFDIQHGAARSPQRRAKMLGKTAAKGRDPRVLRQPDFGNIQTRPGVAIGADHASAPKRLRRKVGVGMWHLSLLIRLVIVSQSDTNPGQCGSIWFRFLYGVTA